MQGTGKMTPDNGLALYSTLTKIRLRVIANSALPDDEELMEMHDKLISGLNDKIAIARDIATAERTAQLMDSETDRDHYLSVLYATLTKKPVCLVDELEIDASMQQHRINGGAWRFVPDLDGVPNYPVRQHLAQDELGGLHDIMEELIALGVTVNAYRVGENIESVNKTAMGMTP